MNFSDQKLPETRTPENHPGSTGHFEPRIAAHVLLREQRGAGEAAAQKTHRN